MFFNEHGVFPRYNLIKNTIKFNEDNIKTKESLNAFMIAIENAMVVRIYDSLKFKLRIIDKGLGYKYSDSILKSVKSLSSNVCKKYKYAADLRQEHNITGVHKGTSVLDDSLVYVLSQGRYIVSYYSDYKVLNDNQFMVCNFDKKTSNFKLILKDIADKFNKIKFGFDRDYSRASDFYKTKYFRAMLQKELKYKKMEVPLNFNSESYAQFKKYYTKSIYKNATKTLTQMVANIVDMNYKDYVKEYGYVRLNINEKQLFELPEIKKTLKKNMPFLYDKNEMFVHRYRTNKFNNSSSLDKLPTIKENFAREQKKFLTEFATNPVAKANVLDNYGKSLVVPPFVLLVSTIMIIVNLVSLFWRFVSIKNFKARLATNVLFFTFIALFPLIFSNTYVETKYYERLVKHGTPESYVLTTVWLQNTNVLFEKSYIIGQVFEPLIDLFEYNVLLYDTDDGSSEVRKRSLRDKIKS